MGAVATLRSGPAALLLGLLAGCVQAPDAPRLHYHCPTGMGFEVRLYRDMALIEGERGHAVLERIDGDAADSRLRYADRLMQAEFGLGVERRLVRLDYVNIPEPVYCDRVSDPQAGAAQVPVRAADRAGPRRPAPFVPNAPIETNIRFGEGPIDPG